MNNFLAIFVSNLFFKYCSAHTLLLWNYFPTFIIITPSLLFPENSEQIKNIVTKKMKSGSSRAIIIQVIVRLFR